MSTPDNFCDEFGLWGAPVGRTGRIQAEEAFRWERASDADRQQDSLLHDLQHRHHLVPGHEGSHEGFLLQVRRSRRARRRGTPRLRSALDEPPTLCQPVLNDHDDCGDREHREGDRRRVTQAAVPKTLPVDVQRQEERG